MTTIGLIDDHFVFSEGLKLLLDQSQQFGHIAIYPCPDSTDQYRLPLNLFDILVLDINLPYLSGFDICSKIKEVMPIQKIVLLSSRIDFDIQTKATEAGADLFVSKKIGTQNLIKEILKIKDSNEPAVDTKIPAFQKITFQNGLEVRISKQELTFLKLLTFEYTSKEIAEKMFVSEHTVIGYRKNLAKKMEAKNMVGLVKYALELYPQSYY